MAEQGDIEAVSKYCIHSDLRGYRLEIHKVSLQGQRTSSRQGGFPHDVLISSMGTALSHDKL